MMYCTILLPLYVQVVLCSIQAMNANESIDDCHRSYVGCT
jgi:hypothetical protein